MFSKTKLTLAAAITGIRLGRRQFRSNPAPTLSRQYAAKHLAGCGLELDVRVAKQRIK